VADPELSEDVEQPQASSDAVPFHLVHSVRGRARLRVDPPHDVDTLGRAIARILAECDGIQEIRVNPESRSVVVTYDPNLLRVEEVYAPAPDSSDEGPLSFVWQVSEEALGAGWLTVAREAVSSWLTSLGGVIQWPREVLRAVGEAVDPRRLTSLWSR